MVAPRSLATLGQPLCRSATTPLLTHNNSQPRRSASRSSKPSGRPGSPVKTATSGRRVVTPRRETPLTEQEIRQKQWIESNTKQRPNGVAATQDVDVERQRSGSLHDHVVPPYTQPILQPSEPAPAPASGGLLRTLFGAFTGRANSDAERGRHEEHEEPTSQGVMEFHVSLPASNSSSDMRRSRTDELQMGRPGDRPASTLSNTVQTRPSACSDASDA